jgi:hypothetical protein
MMTALPGATGCPPEVRPWCGRSRGMTGCGRGTTAYRKYAGRRRGRTRGRTRGSCHGSLSRYRRCNGLATVGLRARRLMPACSFRGACGAWIRGGLGDHLGQDPPSPLHGRRRHLTESSPRGRGDVGPARCAVRVIRRGRAGVGPARQAVRVQVHLRLGGCPPPRVRRRAGRRRARVLRWRQ